jgi:N-glycosylase/DNA lyase
VGKFVFRVTKTRAIVVLGARDESIDSSTLLSYFSPYDSLDSIFESFPRDDFLNVATKEFRGLRILNQDPWECLISFVCSINKNIPSIRNEIENLCERFGKNIRTDFGTYRSFPEPESLASASKKELGACKVGFRWKYIKFIAEKVVSGELDFNKIGTLSYEQARDCLVSDYSGITYGVGRKVADCELLFSMRKPEAFPIDVWVLRCLREKYSKLLELKKIAHSDHSFTPSSYRLYSEIMRKHFGRYAGYAQQYLYMKTRNDYLHSRKRAGLNGKAN